MGVPFRKMGEGWIVSSEGKWSIVRERIVVMGWIMIQTSAAPLDHDSAPGCSSLG